MALALASGVERMRKGIIAGAIIAVVVGGAYYGLAVYPIQAFRAALDQAAGALPSGTRATYKDARYSLLSGRATITGIAVHRDAPDNFDLTIDALAVTKPALDAAAAWAQAAANPGAVAPDLAVRLADAATATGISYHDAAGAIAARSVEINRPRAYPWALLHPGVPSLAEARADLLARTRPPRLVDLAPQLRAAASRLLGVGYDGYVVADFAATAHLPPIQQQPARDVSYSIATMTAGAFDRGNLASFTASSVAIAGAGLGNLKLDHIAIADLQARAPLLRWIDGDVSPASFDGLTLKSLTYGPLTVQPAGGAATALGTLSLADVAVAHGAPVAADIAIDGMSVNIAELAALTGSDLADRLGVDRLTLKLALSYRWDIDRRHLTIAHAAIAAKELGALTLSLDLDDAVPDASLELNARLTHALLHYEDASLVKRALAVAAGSGGDADALRQRLIATASQMATTAGDNDALIAASRAVADFLAAPRSLTVELAPPHPVALLSLVAAAFIPSPRSAATLGLAVSANR
jgi:hypothetical protein